MMRLYLDVCCFNRPFDDQNKIRIRLEAEAKLHIQEAITRKRLELAWSYMLDYENSMNPFVERRRAIARWKAHARINVKETRSILQNATKLSKNGLKSKDAIHVACAIAAGCGIFLTTDDRILDRAGRVRGIRIIDPPTFIREAGHDL